MNLSGETAIIGVGATSFERDPRRSPLGMAGEAFIRALADAELEKGAIDGLVVHIGAPRGVDYDTVAQAFGLDLHFCSQVWGHGRFATTVILQAMMAIASGQCTRVACLMAMKNSDIGRIGEADNPFFAELFREGGGPHAEEGQIGMSSPVASAAMAFDLYCRRYGGDRELLAAIPLTFRKHAQLTPDAVARADLTLRDYQAARSIVEPLRLYDCSPVGDGAICVIVSGKADVPAKSAPVWILGGQGLQASRNHFIFAPQGLGIAQQSDRRQTLAEARAQRVYAMAGMTPDDVDVVGVYDSFSPLPLYAFEDFGFCQAGEALSFIQDDRIAIGGAVPTNTAGGQLSHAQMNGWGQLRELVLQLRGGLGERQVIGASVGMWMSVGADALILSGS
ncbi:MAG: hypothetical protein JWR80_8140 [Bradyrhizobium sp.]|nr:hypothetical protein [Bradyrhizobium sp.]